VIHESIERVVSLVEQVPQTSAQLINSHVATCRTTALFEQSQSTDITLNHFCGAFENLSTNIVLDRLDKALEVSFLKLAEQAERRVMQHGLLQAGNNLQFSEGLGSASQLASFRKFVENSYVCSDGLFRVLEVFSPEFRSNMKTLQQSKPALGLQETGRWLWSEFHELLAEVYRLASHLGKGNIDGALLLNQFQRISIQQNAKYNLPYPSNAFTWPKSLELTVLENKIQLRSNPDHVKVSSGHIYIATERAVGSENAWRITFSFIPKPELDIPGIHLAFSRRKEQGHCMLDSTLSCFNIHSINSPIVRAAKAGDCSIGEVRHILETGQASAGDWDYSGRSLLSVGLIVSLTSSPTYFDFSMLLKVAVQFYVNSSPARVLKATKDSNRCTSKLFRD
jgi:hypothetical protein